MAGTNGADSKISQQITNRLSNRGVGSGCHVTVTTKNGEVTLTGTVQQVHQKKLASSAASAVSGVRRVTDLLTVQPPVRR